MKLVSFLLLFLFTKFTLYSQINRDIVLENFKYNVKEIEFIKEMNTPLISKKTEGYYLIVHLYVTNISREERTLSTGMFKLFDSDNYEYSVSDDANIVLFYTNNNNMINTLRDFQPKIQKLILLPFEVPNKIENYSLQVSGGFWTLQETRIHLVHYPNEKQNNLLNNENELIEKNITNLVYDWKMTTISKGDLTNFYAEKVNYYTWKLADKSKVLSDKKDFYKKWNKINIEIDDLQITNEQDKIICSYIKTYSVSNEKDSQNGTIRSRLIFKKFNSKFLIVEEKDYKLN